MLLLTYLLVSCVVSVAVGWYIASNKWQISHKTLKLRLEGTQQQVEADKSVIAKYQAQELALHTQLVKVETINNNLVAQLAEQKQEVNQIQEKLTLQFKNLANELLEEKSRKFTKSK